MARQARQSLDATKKRVTESEKRIDTQLEPFIKKNYWCAPRSCWGRQVFAVFRVHLHIWVIVM